MRLVSPSTVRTLPIRKVEAHARRKGAAVETGRGGHATNVILRGERVPLPKHGGHKEIVHYQIRQLAALFGIDRDAYVGEVLGL